MFLNNFPTRLFTTSTATVPNRLRPDNSPASYHYETTVGGALPVISTLQVGPHEDAACVACSMGFVVGARFVLLVPTETPPGVVAA